MAILENLPEGQAELSGLVLRGQALDLADMQRTIGDPGQVEVEVIGDRTEGLDALATQKICVRFWPRLVAYRRP